MLLKQTLPRASEHLAVIEAEAPVREAAYLMSKPDGRCCHENRHCQLHQSLHLVRLHNQSGSSLVRRIRFVRLASHFLSVQPCTKGAAVTAQFAFGGSSSKSFKRSRGKRSWFELLRNDWHIARMTSLDHRSTSPKTISSEPKIALTSASIDLRQRKSIAARCAKPGALILQRYGLLVPSETR